jgi:hypothetical protein
LGFRSQESGLILLRNAGRGCFFAAAPFLFQKSLGRMVVRTLSIGITLL